MKTVILSDENFERLVQVLHDDERGLEVVRAMTAKLKLPPDRELVALSRQKGPAPEALERAREYRDAGRQAAEDTRLALNDLIVAAYDAGVSPRVLSRWVGLKEARIFEILRARQAAA